MTSETKRMLLAVGKEHTFRVAGLMSIVPTVALIWLCNNVPLTADEPLVPSLQTPGLSISVMVIASIVFRILLLS